MTINNMKDLENIVNKYIVKALELTRDEIFQIISQKVSDYYNEDVFREPPTNTPDFYERTYNLMESLSATHVIKNGNIYEFRVGWDSEYLSFRYKKGFGDSKYNGITGLQVLNAFNSSTHGYTVQGEHNYWDEAINELNTKYGSLNNLFKINCKKVGLPIS